MINNNDNFRGEMNGTNKVKGEETINLPHGVRVEFKGYYNKNKPYNGKIRKYVLCITPVTCLVFFLSWISFKLGAPSETPYILYALVYIGNEIIRLKMMKELLDSGKKFTCIYAVADALAIGACKAIFDAGKSIPGDYSVAGFDGQETAAYYHPSITTVYQPREEMAEATINILFHLIKKEPVETKRIFNARLVLGESTRKIEK